VVFWGILGNFGEIWRKSRIKFCVGKLKKSKNFPKKSKIAKTVYKKFRRKKHVAKLKMTRKITKLKMVNSLKISDTKLQIQAGPK
jgi:hypothetical protein